MITILAGLILFIHFNRSNNKDITIKINFITEDLIKFLFFIFMTISLVIPPISSPSTVIVWKEIDILNYLRAIIFLIGLTFLPGACLYNIFLNRSALEKKFNIEPFFLKITFYPLLSFSFLGISVLILDQIGLVSELLGMVLYLTIISVYLLDLLVKKKKK